MSNEALHDASDALSDVSSHEVLKGDDRLTERETDRSTVPAVERMTSHHSSLEYTRNTAYLTERATQQQTLRLTERVTYHNDPVMTLTVRQGMCLYYLLQRPDYIAQRHTMGEVLNLPLPTIRDCITALVRERFISKPSKIVIRSFQGFTYRLVDEEQCARFLKLRGDEFVNTIQRNMVRHTPHPTERSTLRMTYPVNDGAYDGTSNVFSPISSSRESITSTTPEPPDQTDQLKDPELVYWTEKGVNNRQISKWVDEFQIPVEQLIQCLKYCRFEMVVLNIEEEKQINSPLSWFYKVMQRSGVYPKPNGYKSLIEIRAEMMEQAAREAAEVRERQEKAERDLAFQTILSKPDSAEYQALYSRTSDLAREMGGKMLALALRDAFNKERGIASDESQG